jgi:threonine dehydratase
MLKLKDIVMARVRIEPHIRHTPLIHSDALSERSGANVWLKLECWQFTGSFKTRGALHKIMSLSEDQLKKGVVTASAGNHGLGTAYAAQVLGPDNVTIFVPQSAPVAKITKLARFPITLKKVGHNYDAAHAAAEQYAAETGAIYISAYDDPEVIAGAGTCALEIMTELPNVEKIIAPVGGGGLIAGTAVAVRGINPGCQVIGVQPAASPAAKLSLEQNRPFETYQHDPTIADGLAGGFGAYPFHIARTLIDDIWLYNEDDLRRAIFTLIDQEQLVVEASGAIAIAPLLNSAPGLKNQTVVCILSGANIDSRLLADILGQYAN